MSRELETRVRDAEEKINRHGDRIATIEGKLAPPVATKLGVGLAQIVVTAAITALLAFLYWSGSSIVSVREDISAIKVSIGSLQKGQVVSSLNMAEQDAKNGRLQLATEQVQQATALVENLSDQKLPVSAGFFEQTFEKLRNISSNGVSPSVVNDAAIQLAEYRSALQPIPKVPGKVVTISATATADEIAKQLRQAGIGSIKAAYPNLELFSHPPGALAGKIEGGIFIGGRQNLEGMTFEGTTFIKTEIFYEGTLPAQLTNVTFIQCAFSVPGQQKAPNPLLEYAALKQEKAKLTP